jgi:hypothetical protein
MGETRSTYRFFRGKLGESPHTRQNKGGNNALRLSKGGI